MKNYILTAAFCGLCALATPAFAQETFSADPSYVSLGAGLWDAFKYDDNAADFRVEYRHGAPLFWKIKPFVAAEATTDGSVWGGAGILLDLKLASNIYVTPSFGAGLYAHGSSDKDLDYPVEFRSQIEGGYEFMNGHRAGIALSHLSNAGLGDDNPGVEVINFYYHIPINNLF